MFGEKMTLIKDVVICWQDILIGDIIKYVIMYPPLAMAAVNYSFVKITFSFWNFSAEANGQEIPETQI